MPGGLIPSGISLLRPTRARRGGMPPAIRGVARGSGATQMVRAARVAAERMGIRESIGRDRVYSVGFLFSVDTSYGGENTGRWERPG
jgi:hypothetical protein